MSETRPWPIELKVRRAARTLEIDFDDGAHFASTLNLPPPPAPPPEQPDEPGPSSLPADSGGADALLRLSELHRSGELTDDEFAAAKTRLLSN